MARSTLLAIDAGANLLLGVLLVAFPAGLVEFLGIPSAESGFYPSVLGAVLIGIGIALIIERFRRGDYTAGLGLHGAASINLCAGVVLSAWLLFGNVDLPTRGFAVLWSLVALLVAISVLELFVQDTGHEQR